MPWIKQQFPTGVFWVNTDTGDVSSSTPSGAVEDPNSLALAGVTPSVIQGSGIPFTNAQAEQFANARAAGFDTGQVGNALTTNLGTNQANAQWDFNTLANMNVNVPQAYQQNYLNNFLQNLTAQKQAEQDALKFSFKSDILPALAVLGIPAMAAFAGLGLGLGGVAEGAGGAGLAEGAGGAGWGITQGAGAGTMDVWDLLGSDLGMYGLGDAGTAAASGAGGVLGGIDYSGIPLDLGAEFGTNPSTLGLTNLVDYSGIPLELGGEFGTNPSTLALSDQSWLQKLGSLPYDQQISAINSLQGLSGSDWYSKLKSIIPGVGGAGGGGNSPWGTNPSTGGILGSLFGGKNNNLASLLGLPAILGGLAYAYNNTGFDTSKLNDLYGQYNPNAMAGKYDLNTNLGRDELTSGLQRRGVMGSSFGNMDLTNYNTARDIGRAQLIGNAVTPAANLANSILGANVAQKKLQNDLIGQGLYSIGTLFGGR